MFGVMKSGKTYRNEGRKGPKYIPLISPPLSDKEGVTQASLLSAIQLIKQGFPRLPPPPTPPPPSPPSTTTSPTPSPPPPQFNMANSVKLPLFKGLGNEEFN